MSATYENNQFGLAGNISLAAASGAITGDFCEIRCIGSTTFTTLVDALEKTSAVYGNKATGTVTVSALPAADGTLVVHGITYTFKAEPATAVQIAIGVDGETAANIAAAVAANDPAVTLVAATGAQASGTFTLTDNPIAAEVLEVNSIEYTFVAEATLPTHIEIGAGEVETAAAVAAAVAANDPLVTAVANAGEVTFTAVAAGNGGNAFTLTTDATNGAVSAGGTLTGGTDVVTITAVAGGTGGNAFTLTENATGIAVSAGGTLTGGTSLVAAQAVTYPDGQVLRGKFTAVRLAGGNARLTISSPR